MKFISLFCGIGGFDLALERLGHECVYANDIDKYCKIVYDRHFRTKLDLRDIRSVRPEQLPDFDLLTGGFPCQSFSIAGKRGGFQDTRGTLFFEIARLANAKRPTYLFLENVKGLLSHDNGRTFETIMWAIDELGYDAQWQICNSKNFGVPQNRERVFIIGHLRGKPRPQVFPLRSTDEIRPRSSEAEEKIYAGTLTARQFASWNGNYIKQVNQPRHSNDRVYEASGISPTLNTMQGGNRQPKIITRQPLRFLQRNQKNFDGEYSFTVDTSNTGGVKVDGSIRRLTPLEAERLQGFPDNWTEGVSETQRYKMLGNAVTVNTVHEIARRAFS